ncbi:MAG: hypothetical protein H6741_25740 [Alphaproteobacteria bacterium]|nr:hypothetical protein [Alphaproteobacteria bacterium]MCB9796114.1 hypothetical protein [Alphaproteobacteria bacterium]
MSTCRLTDHAVERAVQRLGWPRLAAPERLRAHFRRSVKLPPRYARHLNGLSRLRRRPKVEPEYRVAGSVFMVCRRGRVLTVWSLDEEQVATVLVWAVSGIWPH